MEGTKDSFPEGHTCGCSMYIPSYSSKELMKRNMLTAFRLCGEIDIDGDNQNYGSEHDRDDSDYGGEDYRANENDDGGDQSSYDFNMVYLHFPIFKMLDNKKSKKNLEDSDDENEKSKNKWSLDQLSKDDDANKPDLTLQEYDFNANRFAI